MQYGFHERKNRRRTKAALQRYVSEHPGSAVLFAVLAGFVVGGVLATFQSSSKERPQGRHQNRSSASRDMTNAYLSEQSSTRENSSRRSSGTGAVGGILSGAQEAVRDWFGTIAESVHHTLVEGITSRLNKAIERFVS